MGEPAEDEDPEKDMLAVCAGRRRVRILKNNCWKGFRSVTKDEVLGPADSG
jgi:hypothetical protein